nr:hypothetical protein [Isoptericola halotolerans]
MARSSGLVPVGLWDYPLYGGTQVLTLARHGSRPAAAATAAERVVAELTLDVRSGVCRAEALRDLDRHVGASTTALRAWLDAQPGPVVGYGAASRAVALLAAAGVTSSDVEVVVDASPAKRGRAMPGRADGRVPIVGPEELDRLRPDRVLLLVPDLLDEVRQAYPQVEQHGGRWVVAEPEPRVVPPLTGS